MTTQTPSTAPSNAERTASWSSRAARTIEQSIATALRLVRGSQDESQSVAADERQRQQARAFFVALADSKQHRAAIQSVGIRAFLKQADAQTDADFDRLWRWFLWPTSKHSCESPLVCPQPHPMQLHQSRALNRECALSNPSARPGRAARVQLCWQVCRFR